ncbi:type I restriction-modification system subunit M/S [Veillonella caviae]|uniref:type I restriction-modification system subunit M/S n=1 Tax=Veillonella caviae TaxID=248316 RepID=UPI0023F95A9C|nr:type I restriction-modification system subunit M/S [Veillonella caviae]
MEYDINVIKSMYMEYTKEVKVFVDEWRAVSFQHDTQKFGAEVIAALVYFYKKNGMDFEVLDTFFSSNSINNLHFQNIIKAYITKPFIKSFIEQKRIIGEELLLGIALFHGQYSRMVDTEDNNSLNTVLELLLDFDKEQSASFLQIGAGTGKICTNIVTRYNVSEYAGFEREDELMVVLQLRVLLLQCVSNMMISSDFLEGSYPAFREDFDRILCISPWKANISLNGAGLNSNIKKIIEETNLVIRTRDWMDIIGAFYNLSNTGKMVTLLPNSSLSGAIHKSVREYFVKNGFIETVIELPNMLLNGTNISLYAMVLSKGNKMIRFIDASELYVSERRRKIIEIDTFKAVLLDPSSDMSKVVPLEGVLEEEGSLLPKRYTVKNISITGTSLGDVCDIKRGPAITSKELDAITTCDNTGIKYVYSKAIDEDSVALDELPFIDLSQLKKKAEVTEEDCLLVTRTSPFRTKMLRLNSDIKAVLNGNTFSVKIKPKFAKKYLIEYVALFFKSELGRTQIERLSMGNVIQSISINDLRTIVIPDLSIEEQQDLVNRVNEIHREKEKLSTKIRILSADEHEIIKEAFNW